MPAVYYGFIPTPVLVIIAVVAGLTLNSSATNFTQATKGASSGTEILQICDGLHLRSEGELRVGGIRDFEGHLLSELFLLWLISLSGGGGLL